MSSGDEDARPESGRDAERLYEDARRLSLDGEYGEAIARAHEAREVEPLSPSPALLLGWIYEHMGGLAEARRWYDEAIRVSPENPDALYPRAYIEALMGNPEEFYRRLRTVADLPESPHQQAASGFLAARDKRHEDAVRHFRRAVELDPSQSQWFAAIGANLCQRKRYEEALRAYGRVEGQYVNHDTLAGVGITLLRMGRRAEARDALLRALQVHPDYGPAHLHLALLALREFRFRDARRHFGAAIRDVRRLAAAAVRG